MDSMTGPPNDQGLENMTSVKVAEGTAYICGPDEAVKGGPVLTRCRSHRQLSLGNILKPLRLVEQASTRINK
jgi:hypothetical protein